MSQKKLTPYSYGENFTLWDPLIKKYCQIAEVPWEWIKVIAMIESSLGLDPRVARGLDNPFDIVGSRSADGLSWGLLQLRVETARDFDMLANPPKLNDPSYSVRIGSLLMRRLYKAFDGEEEWCIKAWNQGQGASLLEKLGKITGKASEYWDKYLEHKAILNG